MESFNKKNVLILDYGHQQENDWKAHEEDAEKPIEYRFRVPETTG
jgi:hypothetical protein